nr:flagella biosynthesis protein FliZ [Bacillus pacificus]
MNKKHYVIAFISFFILFSMHPLSAFAADS